MINKAIEAACEAYDVSGDTTHFGKMRAAIAAYEQAMWRPIDNEAKTGELFLVLEKGKHLPWLARWWNCYSPFYRSEIYGFWTSTDPSRAHVILSEDATLYRPIPFSSKQRINNGTS